MKKILAVVLLFIAVLICQQAEAAPDLAGMQQSTVHIFSLVGNGGASGSGFLVGNGEYAVTNWHVVNLVQKGARLFVINSKQQKTTAQVAWHSATKDLAILKLDSGSMGRPVSFTPKSGVQVGENVYVMGFPGVVDDVKAEVTVTRGIVSRAVHLDNGVSYYQTDAAVNHGNSGGPMFDDQGKVIVIVAMKPVNKEDAVEGIGFAIQCDELLPALSAAGISYNTNGAANTPAPAPAPQPEVSTDETKEPEQNKAPVDDQKTGLLLWAVIAVSLGGGILALGIWLFQRNNKQTASRAPQIGPNGSPRPSFRQPVLIGVAGPYSGQVIPIETLLIIGRDPNQANLIFGAEVSGISRVHCVLSFDSNSQCFWLEERSAQPSRNGTFLSNGERLQPGRRYGLKSGERFYLSERGIMFEVRIQ